MEKGCKNMSNNWVFSYQRIEWIHHKICHIEIVKWKFVLKFNNNGIRWTISTSFYNNSNVKHPFSVRCWKVRESRPILVFPEQRFPSRLLTRLSLSDKNIDQLTEETSDILLLFLAHLNKIFGNITIFQQWKMVFCRSNPTYFDPQKTMP